MQTVMTVSVLVMPNLSSSFPKLPMASFSYHLPLPPPLPTSAPLHTLTITSTTYKIKIQPTQQQFRYIYAPPPPPLTSSCPPSPFPSYYSSFEGDICKLTEYTKCKTAKTFLRGYTSNNKKNGWHPPLPPPALFNYLILGHLGKQCETQSFSYFTGNKLFS